MTTTNYLLTSDGDTTVIDDITYRLRIEPDMDASINDYDCYGTYGYGKDNPYTGVAEAPRDMRDPQRLTILNDLVWWDPPVGYESLPSEQQNEFRWFVSQLISFGFHVVFVERLDGTDAYGKAVVADYDCVGAVESLEQVAEVAAEMLEILRDRA